MYTIWWEMSNTTDWINTISNVMIAGSAIYGALRLRAISKVKMMRKHIMMQKN